jgi:putative phosphoesterase
MQTIGVISDTHVPDKARALNPRALEIFRDARVSAILHAGDISTPGVLQTLGEVAPVHAVKGNRDWVALSHLPRKRTLTVGGVKIALAHGHGGLWRYLQTKYQFIWRGYDLGFFLPPLLADFVHERPNVLVFGHTHRPANFWQGEMLIFNPGAACCFEEEIKYGPAIGLLHIAEGRPRGEVILLDGSHA